MPILNYTTGIKTEKTLGEIRQILVNHGATKIVTDYQNKIPVSVTFAIELDGRLVPYSLPANHKGVLNAMQKDIKIPKRYKTEEQAVRVSWRIIKDWIEAQMALIDAHLAEMTEVFLPYLITKKGNTLYTEFKEKGTFLLDK
ncbi:hypothetical protein BKI52_12615 [marine bacterium AO1-C]|nr:hypothetical protein BKI52_12615 [marine bacterium AO1-C]